MGVSWGAWGPGAHGESLNSALSVLLLILRALRLHQPAVPRVKGQLRCPHRTSPGVGGTLTELQEKRPSLVNSLFSQVVCVCVYFFLFLFRAASMAYESSWARGPIRATAAGLHHSHRDKKSEPGL